MRSSFFCISIATVVVALAVHCASNRKLEKAPVPVDVGSPSDVHTQLGQHDGFVLGTCEIIGHQHFFVQGSGAKRLLPEDVQQWSEGAKVRLRAFATAQPWVTATAFGKGCNGGGTISYVDNWRNLDSVIQIVGPRLSRYSDIVTFVVSGKWVDEKKDSTGGEEKDE